MYNRILKLISEEELKKIENANILLIGLGGVGGFAFEALIRSGFHHITVVDKDSFELSNLNRQILATNKTIGKEKVKIAQKRAKMISPEIKVKVLKTHLKKEDITDSFLFSYDYIIDACDTVEVKIELIKKCAQLKKKCISSMGTANRIHPEMLEIIPLKQTSYDPLAKKIRQALKNEKKALNTLVVCSKEQPRKNKFLGSLVPVPMASGAILISKVIEDIIK